jgi:hypothetical protein
MSLRFCDSVSLLLAKPKLVMIQNEFKTNPIENESRRSVTDAQIYHLQSSLPELQVGGLVHTILGFRIGCLWVSMYLWYKNVSSRHSSDHGWGLAGLEFSCWTWNGLSET